MIFKAVYLTILLVVTQKVYSQRCTYGQRGSLTSICTNAVPETFKTVFYRFDHLDETVQCVNCTLTVLTTGNFDITANYIKHLDISNSKITTIRQATFVGLIFLEELNMENNQIKTLVRGTFKGIKKLRKLLVSHNNISSLEADSLAELVNLEYLDMSHNVIMRIEESHLEPLKKLKEINLSYNMIKSFDGVSSLVSSLEKLDLSYNELTPLCCGMFDNLPNLVELNLSYNKICNVSTNAFKNQNQLRKLDLSYNHIESLEERAFVGLYNLEYLNMEGCQLKKIGQKDLFGLHSTKTINLSGNKLKLFETGKFSLMPDLVILNISKNDIVDILFNGRFKIRRLHILDASANRLDSLNYKSLKLYMPVLSYILVRFNRFPCHERIAMRKYFIENNMDFEVSPDKYTDSVCEFTGASPASAESAVELAFEQEMELIVPERNVIGSGAFYSLIVIILLLMAILVYHKYRRQSSKVIPEDDEEHSFQFNK